MSAEKRSPTVRVGRAVLLRLRDLALDQLNQGMDAPDVEDAVRLAEAALGIGRDD